MSRCERALCLLHSCALFLARGDCERTSRRDATRRARELCDIPPRASTAARQHTAPEPQIVRPEALHSGFTLKVIFRYLAVRFSSADFECNGQHQPYIPTLGNILHMSKKYRDILIIKVTFKFASNFESSHEIAKPWILPEGTLDEELEESASHHVYS